jgi:DNA sulfur modification protein DndC
MLTTHTLEDERLGAEDCSDSTLNIWDQVVDSVRAEYLSEEQDYPWIIGFSGGKDSTVVAQAVFEALLQVPPSKRRRFVHVVSNDTFVRPTYFGSV